MSGARAPNREIVIIVEGDTERAAVTHIKSFIDARAGAKPKVRLHPILLNGGLTKERLHDEAEAALANDSTIAVVALTDVFPAFRSAAHARETVASWMPADARCHARVACHDFEAWLLVGWDALLEKARVGSQKPWGVHPEDVNTDKPPAHRIRSLFQLGKPKAQRYSKVIHGGALFRKLRVEDVAGKCPEFKAFVNCLLSIADYPTIA